MERTTSNLSKLPETAYIDNKDRRVPETDAPILGVKRGEAGFYPIYTRRSADELNAAENVSPAQREAMFFGSVFGFHTPSADVDSYDADGNLIGAGFDSAPAFGG